MVLLEKLWDDVVAGPQPERGLGKLRKLTTVKTGAPFYTYTIFCCLDEFLTIIYNKYMF